MRFVSVHGGWQGGWAWDGVTSVLRACGHEVFAPTLRGLEEGDVDRSGLTLSDIARDVVQKANDRDLRDLVPAAGTHPFRMGRATHRVATLLQSGPARELCLSERRRRGTEGTVREDGRTARTTLGSGVHRQPRSHVDPSGRGGPCPDRGDGGLTWWQSIAPAI